MAITGLKTMLEQRPWMLSRVPHYIYHVSLKIIATQDFATVKVVHGPNVLASLVIVRRGKYW